MTEQIFRFDKATAAAAQRNLLFDSVMSLALIANVSSGDGASRSPIYKSNALPPNRNKPKVTENLHPCLTLDMTTGFILIVNSESGIVAAAA